MPIALPRRQRRPSTLSLFLGVSLVFGSPCAWVIAGQIRSHLAKEPVSQTIVHAASLSATKAVDEAQALISRCGPPDQDISTANNDPRPPIPFRVLDYKAEHLRFAFVPGAGAKIGDPPPYIWALSGILDTTTNQRITPAEAAQRMSCVAPPGATTAAAAPDSSATSASSASDPATPQN
ncbi:MAG: hypothetical protein KGL59_09755 [Acidobacteriota bacterium]|nr:hypothetical protein [Acidobacteriota bacterium]